MKKLIFTLLCSVLLVATAFAQTSFSCVYREYCVWSDYKKKFVDCEGYEESSLFVINDNETIFTHTIDEMKSSYYVTSREYDAKEEIWSYQVTSDVGNKYLYVIDPKNKQIRGFYLRDGKTMLVVFTIKAIF